MPDTLIILATIGSCWNHAKEALASLRTAGVEDCPIILVADEISAEQRAEFFGGTDFAMPMPMQLNESAVRRGIVGAYNAGFEVARSGAWPHIHLLEDGIRVTPGYLAAMHRVLDVHPEFGWVACGQIENDKAPFTPLCSLMTRACAEAVKGLDPLFAPCQFDDGDLFMRCLQAGFTPYAVDHKVSHPVSRTSREGTLEQDWALVLDHRDKFQRRWQIPDSPLHQVPVHACERCK